MSAAPLTAFAGGAQRRLHRLWRPPILLAAVTVAGVGARVFHLRIPSEQRVGQGYIFDERYYVNAARVIARVPMHAAETYARASPPGTDPNAEHPQLGKLVIAGSIRLFGDNPVGWRITSVLFGTAAILLLYWLVRCAGGSSRLALGAAALGTVDNLWLVSSRIAVLDIYCVPFMLAAAAFYLRRRPVVAGVLVGVGACVKEFGAYALAVLIVFELLRLVRMRPRGRRLVRALATPLALVLATVVTYLSLLTVLDIAVTPYHDGSPVDRGQSSACGLALIWSRACNHTVFMSRYASTLRTSHPQGIASYPWQFWLDRKEIDYFRVGKTVTHGSETSSETVIRFRGMINRVLLATSWLAILFAIGSAAKVRDNVSFVVIAWIAGTWLPAELLSLLYNRITYLYYMVVVMPGVYIAVARFVRLKIWPRWLVLVWVALLLAEFANLYPFRTLSGT